MNNDDIIRMALAAGLEQDGDNFFSRNYEEMDVHIDDLKRFAEIVAKARDAEHAEKLKYDIHSCGPTCERYVCVAIRNAAAELRRLHELNQELLVALKNATRCLSWHAERHCVGMDSKVVEDSLDLIAKAEESKG